MHALIHPPLAYALLSAWWGVYGRVGLGGGCAAAAAAAAVQTSSVVSDIFFLSRAACMRVFCMRRSILEDSKKIIGQFSSSSVIFSVGETNMISF